jgi:hypothetical protein
MAETTYRLEDGVIIENTAEEAAAFEARLAAETPETEEDYENQIRQQRNALLAKSDWTVLTDSPLTTANKTKWKTYRQALRDLPSSSDWPNVTFPEEPTL